MDAGCLGYMAYDQGLIKDLPRNYKLAVFEPIFREVFKQGTLDGITRVSQWAHTHLLTSLAMEAMRKLLMELFEAGQTLQSPD